MKITQNDAYVISKTIAKSNSASYSDLVSTKASQKALGRLLRNGVLRQRTRSLIRCPNCAYELEERLGIVLYCKNCRNEIELNDDNRMKYSNYSIVEMNLVEITRDYYRSKGFDLSSGLNTNIASVNSIGENIDVSSNICIEFVIISKPMDTTLLYSLVGYSLTTRNYLVAFYEPYHPELDHNAAELIALPRIQLIPISSIANETTTQQIHRFQKFSIGLSSIIHTINQITETDQKFSMTREELDFLESAKLLSRTGREEFEPVVLRLLQTIGITSRAKKKGYGPEGALYLPVGYYVIDAKSTKTSFSFRIDERDKILRYNTLMQSKAHRMGNYPFLGEIIVTPSLPSPVNKVLDKVEDYFQKYPIKGRLIVITIEGLLKLYQNATQNMEYFARRILKEHPIQLFQKPHQFTDNATSQYDYETVSYIDESILQRFFEHVMKSQIPELNGRDVVHLTEHIIGAFSEDSFL